MGFIADCARYLTGGWLINQLDNAASCGAETFWVKVLAEMRYWRPQAEIKRLCEEFWEGYWRSKPSLSSTPHADS